MVRQYKVFEGLSVLGYYLVIISFNLLNLLNSLNPLNSLNLK